MFIKIKQISIQKLGLLRLDVEAIAKMNKF